MKLSIPEFLKEGRKFYGDSFVGYMKVAELREFIMDFKNYYYEKKIENPNLSANDILRSFNIDVCAPKGKMFHPYPVQIKKWSRKWDMYLAEQGKIESSELMIKDEIPQIIKTRDDEQNLILAAAPPAQDIDAGVRTLGGELLNDAFKMLQDDQKFEEIYDDETLMRRRNYVVNVFAHATKLALGSAALMLKASEEKRSTATFLMSLLSRATAGKMTEDEMSLLRSAYAPKQEVVKTE